MALKRPIDRGMQERDWRTNGVKKKKESTKSESRSVLRSRVFRVYVPSYILDIRYGILYDTCQSTRERKNIFRAAMVRFKAKRRRASINSIPSVDVMTALAVKEIGSKSFADPFGPRRLDWLRSRALKQGEFL